ncbi:MAG: hypothetical protein HZC54_02785 [Verrucomicrobia bacterium]|nr:hypothetical protein [Verrucomicrobiota bacterium]
MSLESFYHEVAMRQASADRDSLKSVPPWWRRCLTALPPTARRLLALTAMSALATAGWWLHPHINQYVLGNSPHPPSAADLLVTVVRRASPVERAHRLVLACARENNAHACQKALRQALTIAQPQVVVLWLKEKEVHALRANAYFDRFAAKLETHPDRLDQLSATPARAAVPTSYTQTPGIRATQTKSSFADPAGGLPTRLDGSGFLSNTPGRNAARLLGGGVSMQMSTAPSPQASLDVSSARSINPTDAVNTRPAKINSVDALLR